MGAHVREVRGAENLRVSGGFGSGIRLASIDSVAVTETAFTTEAQRTQRDPVTFAVIGAAIDVHRVLGPGLLESAYVHCLSCELALRGIVFEREVPIPVFYKGTRLDVSYRADLIVEKCVLVEVKSVKAVEPIHQAQLHTYLRLTGISRGLLLNFNVRSLRSGILRVVL
jgi:GxxExxY protein